MSAHEQALGATDEWYTPPYVFDAMGARFHMDVAHPGGGLAHWIPAEHYLTHDSLARHWAGFVWMNPPFGKRMGLTPWLRKFFRHGNGVALAPDRTSAPWWQDAAPRSDAVLFVKHKIKFIRPDGSVGKQPGTGTTLFAIGELGVEALELAAINGLGVVFKSSSRSPDVGRSIGHEVKRVMNPENAPAIRAGRAE